MWVECHYPQLGIVLSYHYCALLTLFCSSTIIVAAVPVVLISSLVDSLLCSLTLPASIAVAADGSKKLKYKMYIMQRCAGRHYAVADIAKLCGSRPPTGEPALKIPWTESFFQKNGARDIFGN